LTVVAIRANQSSDGILIAGVSHNQGVRTMRRIACGSFLVGILVALAIVGLSVLDEGDLARAGAGDVTLVAVDMDTTAPWPGSPARLEAITAGALT
jgi:hypothetical protein